jgi:hypothetical protein
MAWCEANRVGYVSGLARDSRLENARLRSIAPPHTENRAAAGIPRAYGGLVSATLRLPAYDDRRDTK